MRLKKSPVGRGEGNTVHPVPFEYSQEKAAGKKSARSHLICPAGQRQRVLSLKLIRNEQKGNGLKDPFFSTKIYQKNVSFHFMWFKTHPEAPSLQMVSVFWWSQSPRIFILEEWHIKNISHPQKSN